MAAQPTYNNPAPKSGVQVKEVSDAYMQYFNSGDAALERRKKESSAMTKKFYDLVTDFYQYGWGDSFHFAPRLRDETFREAIKRHEHFLALKLRLGPGVTCLDLGCGVGGPLVEIGGFSGASITGVNINPYQVQKVQEKVARFGLAGTCDCVQADFMKLPFADNSKDVAYQIEATCHAADRTGCYREAARVLKPGGLFAGYEWVTTPEYNPQNQKDRDICHGIEVGNGLPPMLSQKEILDALEAAGFEVLEHFDVATDARFPIPWYEPLHGSASLTGWRHTRAGRTLTHHLVSWAEWARVVPKGTSDVSTMLMKTAEDLVNGGQRGIFTPSFYYLARKKDASSKK
jgi:sterol 24-C-methyltransferase